MSNRQIPHPHNGGMSFGQVPRMVSRGFIIEAGHIHLLGGKHLGANKGYGAAHIWAAHAKEMAARDFIGYEDVPAYVASIVRTGTQLFFGSGDFRKTKLIAVRATMGTAVLELRDQREPLFWSVVTAYSIPKAHGTLVGIVG